MKKAILMMTLVFAGSFAQADTSDAATRFSTLFMLKTIIAQTADSAKELEGTVQENAEYYRSLRFFQLVEKVNTGRKNCGEVQASNMANGVMLQSLFESSSSALKDIPEINNQEALEKLSKITEYLHESKAADDTCSVPTDSLSHVRKASALISEVNAYLEKIENKIP